MTLLAVYTTVRTRDDARRLAQAALAQRLAACVQLSAIESHYRWQGALEHEDEVRVLFKTTADRYEALRALVLELHPYELPALHALEVARADPAYADWVAQGTVP